MLKDLIFIDRMVEVSPICLHMGRRECSLVLYQHSIVPLHKHLCTEAFGFADAQVDLALAEIEKGSSLLREEQVQSESHTCLSTSDPTVLGHLPRRAFTRQSLVVAEHFLLYEEIEYQVWDCRGKAGLFLPLAKEWKTGQQKKNSGIHSQRM